MGGLARGNPRRDPVARRVGKDAVIVETVGVGQTRWRNRACRGPRSWSACGSGRRYSGPQSGILNRGHLVVSRADVRVLPIIADPQPCPTGEQRSACRRPSFRRWRPVGVPELVDRTTRIARFGEAGQSASGRADSSSPGARNRRRPRDGPTAATDRRARVVRSLCGDCRARTGPLFGRRRTDS